MVELEPLTTISSTLNLLMVMVIVWTSGVIFRKINQPPVLGELLAGLIFGPSFLGIVHPDPTLSVLSELGVFFLMFYAGLETDPLTLKKTGRLATLVGLGGFLVPFVMGYSVCLLFDINNLQALFVGLGLSITAIAVNARVLNDMCLQEYRICPVIIGASIIDDVLSFALFSVIISVAAGGSFFDLPLIVKDLTKVFLFFGISGFIGVNLFPRFSDHFTSRESKGFTFALIMALVFGLMAELAGLHIILGAYMAGLFVRRSITHKGLFQKVNDRFVSITYGFLGPIFFVSLSFHITFDIFQTHLGLLLILLLTAVAGKIIGAGGLAYLGGMNHIESTVVGFAMNGRGAVELVIASVGIKLGIIDDNFFSILVVIAFITTLIPPLSLGVLLRKTGLDGLSPIDDQAGAT